MLQVERVVLDQKAECNGGPGADLAGGGQFFIGNLGDEGCQGAIVGGPEV